MRSVMSNENSRGAIQVGSLMLPAHFFFDFSLIERNWFSALSYCGQAQLWMPCSVRTELQGLSGVGSTDDDDFCLVAAAGKLISRAVSFFFCLIWRLSIFFIPSMGWRRLMNSGQRRLIASGFPSCIGFLHLISLPKASVYCFAFQSAFPPSPPPRPRAVNTP